MPVLFSATTTAQAVMNAVSQDVRNQLSATATPDSTILLDYVNRVSLDLLKVSKWWFLMSPVQSFITQKGVTNYWVGPTGTNPSGTYDTGLNLSDLRVVKPKSVLDRSNFRPLGQINEQPLSARLSFSDASSRPGRPAVWRQDEATPNVINLYPAPDNQTTYSPQPEPPICSIVAGGSLLNRIYFVTITFVDSLGGESTSPDTTEIFVPAGQLLVVNPPATPVTSSAVGIAYNRYNVYAASAGISEVTELINQNTTQQATLVSTASSWTEPTSGLTTTGPNPPSINSVEPIDGYVIQFRYFRQIAQVTSTSQTLQIPDDYFHVVVAGVNSLAFQFLFRAAEAQAWEGRYQQGMQKIVRDLNFMAKTGDYFGPDPNSIGGYLPAVDTTDLGMLAP